MGLVLATSVFIATERRGEPANLSGWDPSDDLFVSAVTVSELLVGVHRADTTTRRERRSAFVEAVLKAVGVIEFTSHVARDHARLHAALMAEGRLIGAHDLIIAATAVHHGLALMTTNVAEFQRVPGLQVIENSA